MQGVKKDECVSTRAPNRVALLNLLGKWSRDIASGKVKPPRTVAG